MIKERLYGKTLAELRDAASELGMPRHAASQMAGWLYKRGAREIAAMTDISAAHRALLEERFEIGLSAPLREAVSADGTIKYLFPVTGITPATGVISATGTTNGGTSGGGESPARRYVESAMIPDGERATLCISSQAGCRMGCDFCATGKQGPGLDLSAGDILNQFASLPCREMNGIMVPSPQWLTNVVYMGMGEPLDNLDAVLRSLEILTSDRGYGWSPARITVSTAGIAPSLDEFLTKSRVHLAVSLHNPFSDERARIMPIERAYPIEEIVGIIRRHDFSHRHRVSFEYIVMSGLNDSPRHVAGLAKLLNGLACRINLIKFHKIPGSPYFSPPQAAMELFRDALSKKGIITTIRASRGEDIEAACGLLSTSHQNI